MIRTLTLGIGIALGTTLCASAMAATNYVSELAIFKAPQQLCDAQSTDLGSGFAAYQKAYKSLSEKKHVSLVMASSAVSAQGVSNVIKDTKQITYNKRVVFEQNKGLKIYTGVINTGSIFTFHLKALKDHQIAINTDYQNNQLLGIKKQLVHGAKGSEATLDLPTVNAKHVSQILTTQLNKVSLFKFSIGSTDSCQMLLIHVATQDQHAKSIKASQ